MSRIHSTVTRLLLFFIATTLLHSCIPHEKLVNFHEDAESEYVSAQFVPIVRKITIQPDDILAVTVSTFDSTAARIFNSRAPAPSADGAFIGQGYLVDDDGYIAFPVLGPVKLAGLTRESAKDTIRNRLLLYLRAPVVEVRFLNLHISVMGEVKRPGLYTFPDERFTILEALTLAGDMTDLANRENIKVIREFDNVREFGKVDLSSSRAFESPYFYLAQNDVIYVEPLKQKSTLLKDPVARAATFASMVTALASILLILR